ncbi:uncharacterized protein [Nicotiana tomentosiformis]|uniref:uncharacterized protein n=1 Tax=Nicotiana tomentosiformis TaxID=4098 RepID=UPI00388C7C50
MNSAQVNYTVTEKELLPIVFAIEKFHPYLMGAKGVVHRDHTALRYLMSKKNYKARLINGCFCCKSLILTSKIEKGVKTKLRTTCLVWRRRGGRMMALKSMTPFPDEQVLAISMKDVTDVWLEINSS